MNEIEALKQQGKEAALAGDYDTARKLLAKVKELQAAPKPEKSFGQTLKENIFGDNDPTTQNTGEKIGQFMRNAGEAMTAGLIGDEATARVASFLGGGSYEDELAKRRYQEDLFAKENPYLDIAADVTGGLTGSLFGGGVLRGLGMAAKAPTWAGNLVRNTASGAAGGGVYGFMEGEGGLTNRATDAAFGVGVGAVAGAAVPEALRLLGFAAKKAGIMRGDPVDKIAKVLGVDKSVARQVALGLDDGSIDEALARQADLGNDFMLADAVPLASVLDAASQGNPAAGAFAAREIGNRVKGSLAEANNVLDTVLGKPVGLSTRKADIKDAGSAERKRLYDEAYRQPVDYASRAGQALEDRLRRVPQGVMANARQMMNMEGKPSQQRKFSINPDGSIDVTKMPDMRELDYVTRALGDEAEASRGKGGLGGLTNRGRIVGQLQSDIRRMMKAMNPKFRDAAGKARDDILSVDASKLGYDILTANVKRDEFAMAMRGMRPNEIKNLKGGLRDYLDDQISRVVPTMAREETDIGEAQKLIKLLGSRDAKDKIKMLLPPDEAEHLLKTMSRSATMMRLLAATAQNSKTAIRTELLRALRDTVPTGSPLGGARDAMAGAAGWSRHDANRKIMAQYGKLVDVLVNTRGPEAAKMLQIIKEAKAGKDISEPEFNRLVSFISTGSVMAAAPRAEEIIQGTAQTIK